MCMNSITDIKGNFSNIKNILVNLDGEGGPQGEQGDKGDKGDTGATGPKGDAGDNKWTDGTNNSIYYNKGFVGIGTSGTPRLYIRY